MGDPMVPVLRFKDEHGQDFPDWVQSRFDDVATIKMGQSPDSASYNENEEGVYLIQGNADIQNRKTSPRQWTSNPTKLCEIGDLIMTVRAPVGAISKSIHKACIGRGVCLIRAKVTSIQNFIYQFLLLFESKWVKLEQGSTFTAVSGSDIKSLLIPIPSLPEQQKIADFLSSVDTKIEQLTRKKELLEKYKTGMMQKLFPKPGEQHPELRFKDEYGQDYPDWNEKKLGSLKDLKHGDGDWILTENITNDERYKVIQLGHIGYGKFQEKEYKTISEDAFEEVKGTLIHKGDLLINRMIDSARVNLCLFPFDGDFITSVDVCWLRSSDYFQNKFLLYSLITYANQKGLLRLSSGSGRVRISKKNMFYRHSIKFPSLSEQQKIADFLSAIDDKITKVEGKLTKAQTFKKGLLQQMFV